MTNSFGSFPPWPDLVAAMGLLKREVEEANDLYPATVPHLAAAPEQLAAAETRLGHPLDPQHREFLSYGNGWPDFSLETTLLSTEELGQGRAWEDINSTLDAFCEGLPGPGIVPPRDQIYPISHDEGASDIFAIWFNGPVTDGGHPVLWLPWQEDTEPYSNFFDFFSACYQTHQKLLARAREP
jgi:hypothetical protein